MKISIFEVDFPKFKQELPSILLLSISQIYLSFNFPAYVRLGNILRFFVGTIISSLSIFSYIVVFSSANSYTRHFDLEAFDDASYAKLWKNSLRGSLVVLAFTTMYFFWRIDFYEMLNLNYIIMYSHFIVTLVLFYKAVYRKPLNS